MFKQNTTKYIFLPPSIFFIYLLNRLSFLGKPGITNFKKIKGSCKYQKRKQYVLEEESGYGETFPLKGLDQSIILF